MPLFMFMAGVSIPFAFARYLGSRKKRTYVYQRMIKRVFILWILGMICQGHLLSFRWDNLQIFSNTLQAIAVGYLFSALLFLHARPSIQVIISAFLLLFYWFLLSFVSVDGYGGGDFTPSGNLAEWADRMLLGRWRTGASIDTIGNTVFLDRYHYTWILSSLNFIVTVMSGVFAGQILKSRLMDRKKMCYLFVIGIAMTVLGWLWHLQMPVIKKIWTSSMVLVSSGYCFLLIGLFFYLIDYRGLKRGLEWLKILGMNSIVAYMLAPRSGIFNFSCIGNSLFLGLKQYMTAEWYQFIVLSFDITLIYLLLYILYKHKIFIKA